MFLLASASPRRKALLEEAGYIFEVRPANIDEKVQFKDPVLHAEKTALKKAEAVKGNVILGADTVVSIDGKIIGKPKDKVDARRILKLLSGKKHSVITGVALIFDGKREVWHEKTDVFFRELTDKEIEDYLETKEPFGKAGAYAIQGKGLKLISKISGSYTNVVGLPMEKVKEMLDSLGIRPKSLS